MPRGSEWSDRRRRLLRMIGSAGLAGLMAGCTGTDSSSPNSTESTERSETPTTAQCTENASQVDSVTGTPANVDSPPPGYTVARGEELYTTEFGNIDDWVIETEDSDDVTSMTSDGLTIASGGGTTAWLDQVFEGNVLIEYDVVVPSHGEHARVSDLNNFWMSDVKPGERSGAFPEYHDLRQYYVGHGGHDNKLNRFRRYPRGEYRDEGESLLGEYDGDPYLIDPDTLMTVQAMFYEGQAIYGVDGELFFRYVDSDPLTEGRFGFRTVNSRKQYQRLSVHRLANFCSDEPLEGSE